MKAIICDRCNGVFSEEQSLNRPITLRIIDGHTVRKQMSRGTIQDLCPNCYNQLKSWFYDMKNAEV